MTSDSCFLSLILQISAMQQNLWDNWHKEVPLRYQIKSNITGNEDQWTQKLCLLNFSIRWLRSLLDLLWNRNQLSQTKINWFDLTLRDYWQCNVSQEVAKPVTQLSCVFYMVNHYNLKGFEILNQSFYIWPIS